MTLNALHAGLSFALHYIGSCALLCHTATSCEVSVGSSAICQLRCMGAAEPESLTVLVLMS